MKNRLTLLSLCLTLAIAVVPSLKAQSERGEGGRERGGPGGPRRPNLERMAEELNLTADQKAKVGPILKQEAEQMKAIRDDQSLSQDQRREKVRAAREEGQKAIAAVLTPEQAKKLADLRAQGPRGGGDRPPRGEKGEHGDKGDKPAHK